MTTADFYIEVLISHKLLFLRFLFFFFFDISKVIPGFLLLLFELVDKQFKISRFSYMKF